MLPAIVRRQIPSTPRFLDSDEVEHLRNALTQVRAAGAVKSGS
jgi:hypothetical protein